MASLNKVMIIGNAGRDAELRYISTGTAQAQFSVAVNNRRKNQSSGEWEDQTEWFNVVVWGDQAERISQYVTKGRQVYVEGRLQTRNWDDDQGQKHYRTEVIAQTIQLLGSRDSQGGGGSSGGGEWGDEGNVRSFGGSRPRGGGFNSGRGGETEVDDLPFE